MLGTTWTAPNEGSTPNELARAFEPNGLGLLTRRFRDQVYASQPGDRTNLKLTGEPIVEYDWQRLDSACFRIGA